MKKLQLKELGISSGEVLSREQLKLLMGGDAGFGSGSQKGSGQGSTKRSDVPYFSGTYNSGSGCDHPVCMTSC